MKKAGEERLFRRLKKIAKQFQIADIYVFGSRAKEIASRIRGDHWKDKPLDADVDIGIYPPRGVVWSPGDLVDITLELEDLFGAPRVDLVVLPEAEAFLALEIIKGEIIYCEDPDEQARYELFVLRRAGDLLPYKKERIRMIIEEGAR